MFCRLRNCRLPARLAGLCILLLMFSACGQKGPLYLPDEAETDETEENADSGN